jgi:hypothetical protein
MVAAIMAVAAVSRMAFMEASLFKLSCASTAQAAKRDNNARSVKLFILLNNEMFQWFTRPLLAFSKAALGQRAGFAVAWLGYFLLFRLAGKVEHEP